MNAVFSRLTPARPGHDAGQRKRSSLPPLLGLLPLLTLFTILPMARPARADQVVVPGAQATAEGNYDNAFPFNLGVFGFNSQRYQQVYAAPSISAGKPVYITALTFRPDGAVGHAFAATLPNVQIDLSTTAKSVDGLSTTFASNVGTDDAVVYSGALSLSSSNTGPSAGPKNFDITIYLSHPFLYDPSKGNLLLDVRNFGGGTTSQFDAVLTSGDAVSRVYTGSTNGVNDTSGFSNSGGLVTGFTLTPVVPVGTTTLRINSGGPAYTDSLGHLWAADVNVPNSATWSFGGLVITGTPDPELYRDVRWSTASFTDHLTAAPGTYTLRLYFVEGDYHAAPGFRTFDVLVNGTMALPNLDVFSVAGGSGKPLVETLDVTVPSTGPSAGGLDVTFQTEKYGAMVSAIELVPRS